MKPLTEEEQQNEAAARHIEQVDHGVSVEVQRFFAKPAEVLMDWRARGICTHHVEGFDDQKEES